MAEKVGETSASVKVDVDFEVGSFKGQNPPYQNEEGKDAEDKESEQEKASKDAEEKRETNGGNLPDLDNEEWGKQLDVERLVNSFLSSLPLVRQMKEKMRNSDWSYVMDMHKLQVAADLKEATPETDLGKCGGRNGSEFQGKKSERKGESKIKLETEQGLVGSGGTDSESDNEFPVSTSNANKGKNKNEQEHDLSDEAEDVDKEDDFGRRPPPVKAKGKKTEARKALSAVKGNQKFKMAKKVPTRKPMYGFFAAAQRQKEKIAKEKTRANTSSGSSDEYEDAEERHRRQSATKRVLPTF